VTFSRAASAARRGNALAADDEGTRRAGRGGAMCASRSSALARTPRRDGRSRLAAAVAAVAVLGACSAPLQRAMAACSTGSLAVVESDEFEATLAVCAGTCGNYEPADVASCLEGAMASYDALCAPEATVGSDCATCLGAFVGSMHQYCAGECAPLASAPLALNESLPCACCMATNGGSSALNVCANATLADVPAPGSCATTTPTIAPTVKPVVIPTFGGRVDLDAAQIQVTTQIVASSVGVLCGVTAVVVVVSAAGVLG